MFLINSYIIIFKNQVGKMSLIKGILSIIKGITIAFKGVLAIKNNIAIKSNSKGSSHSWSIIGRGIKSKVSIIIAKETKRMPPGDKITSVGIFWNHPPLFFFMDAFNVSSAIF